VDIFKDGNMPLNMPGWSEPIALRALAGSVPSDSMFTGYHKAPGSEREYAQVKRIAVYDALVSFAYFRCFTLLSLLRCVWFWF